MYRKSQTHPKRRGQKKSNTKTTTTIINGNKYCNATDQIPITEKERKITNLSNSFQTKILRVQFFDRWPRYAFSHEMGLEIWGKADSIFATPLSRWVKSRLFFSGLLLLLGWYLAAVKEIWPIWRRKRELAKKKTFGREKSRNMCGKRRYLANSFFFLLSVNKRVVVGSKGGEKKKEGVRRVSFSQAIAQHTGGKKIWKFLSRVPHNFNRAPNALKFFNIAVNSSSLVSCRGKGASGFCMYTREEKGRIRGIWGKKSKSKSILTLLPLRNACFLNGRLPPSIYPEHPKIDSRRRRIR